MFPKPLEGTNLCTAVVITDKLKSYGAALRGSCSVRNIGSTGI